MNLATVLPGLVFGLCAAFLLHQLFGWLRGIPVAPAVYVAGWLCILACLWFSSWTFVAYLSMRGDPLASMGPFWGFVSAGLALILLVGAGLAGWQTRFYSGVWPNLFGFVMAEAGTAFGLGYAVSCLRYDLVAPLYKRGEGTQAILDSFHLAREFEASFHIALAVGFVVFALFGPRVGRAMPSVTEPPAAPLHTGGRNG